MSVVMSITDDQIAEIEQAVSFLQTTNYTDVENGTVLAIITRLREAERDAARYRWLRERGDACQWMNILRVELEEFVMQDNALDAAIDAAMQEGAQ